MAKDLDSFIQKSTMREKCSIQRLVGDVADKEGNEVADKLQSIIDNEAFSCNQLALLLRRNGYRVGRDTLVRHRRRGTPEGCICA